METEQSQAGVTKTKLTLDYSFLIEKKLDILDDITSSQQRTLSARRFPTDLRPSVLRFHFIEDKAKI